MPSKKNTTLLPNKDKKNYNYQLPLLKELKPDLPKSHLELLKEEFKKKVTGNTKTKLLMMILDLFTLETNDYCQKIEKSLFLFFYIQIYYLFIYIKLYRNNIKSYI